MSAKTKMRLAKFLAGEGVASRRKSEELIKSGEISVNGELVTEVATLVDPHNDHIKVRGKLLRPTERVYLLLYKPRGYLCTDDDPQKRPLVKSLLGKGHPEGLRTVGRLDFNAEGLLILTNDGEFHQQISHPRNGCKKTYMVKVRGKLDDKERERLMRGGVFEGERFRPPHRVVLAKPGPNCWYRVTIGEGRHHQLKRMFQRVGHPVAKIKRVAIGSVSDPRLRPGKYRPLTKAEVKRLAGESS